MNPALLTLMARYLRSRRGFTAVVTGFSVVGITLGVAALLIVLAVMSGFRQELIHRILGATGHAQMQVAQLTLPTALALAERYKAIPGVTQATPYVTGQVLASAGGRATGAMIRGIPTTFLPPDIATKLQLKNQMWLPTQSLLGVRLAQNLGVVPGSGLTLLSPNGARTPVGLIPRTLQIEVGNLFNMGMMQIDSGLILLPIQQAQDLLKKADFVDAIEIRVKDPQSIQSLVPQLMARTQTFGFQPIDITLTTWQHENEEFMRALQIERVTMFIILSLIIIVAAFNVITGQMMLVNDKLSDIAILRSMGATQRDILTLFFGNGLLLGLAGTLGGLVLGLLGIYNMMPIINLIKALTGVNLFPGDVYFLSDLPGRVSWPDITAVLILTSILTIIASVWPAWRASRFHPVELLRQG